MNLISTLNHVPLSIKLKEGRWEGYRNYIEHAMPWKHRLPDSYGSKVTQALLFFVFLAVFLFVLVSSHFPISSHFFRFYPFLPFSPRFFPVLPVFFFNFFLVLPGSSSFFQFLLVSSWFFPFIPFFPVSSRFFLFLPSCAQYLSNGTMGASVAFIKAVLGQLPCRVIFGELKLYLIPRYL